MNTKIRIEFEVNSRKFVAESYPNEGGSINCEEMLRRLPDTIGEEDARYFYEHILKKFPNWPFVLVTNWRDPDNPRQFQCFAWNGWKRQWDMYWWDLDGLWGGNDLAVRRLA